MDSYICRADGPQVKSLKVTARILHFYIGSSGDVGDIIIEPDKMTILRITVVDTNAVALEKRSKRIARNGLELE